MINYFVPFCFEDAEKDKKYMYCLATGCATS